MAKKLLLKDLKVKSFRTVMKKADQRTAKGGRQVLVTRQSRLEDNGGTASMDYQSAWTEIKSGKVIAQRFANTLRTD